MSGSQHGTAGMIVTCIHLSVVCLCLVGCSPSGEARGDRSSRGQKVQKLPKADLDKVRLEQKNGELAVYNGTAWFLLSVDAKVSAQATNDLQKATRRFRLYPQKSFGGTQTVVIKPYTTCAVDWSDMGNWILGKKLASWEFVEGAGYKE